MRFEEFPQLRSTGFPEYACPVPPVERWKDWSFAFDGLIHARCKPLSRIAFGSFASVVIRAVSSNLYSTSSGSKKLGSSSCSHLPVRFLFRSERGIPCALIEER